MESKGYADGIVRYPTSVIDHKKQSEDPVQQDVDALKEWKEQQETAIPDNVINGIKEIENFLANTPDTETLAELLSSLTTSLTTAISAKYTKPNTGIPKSDLSESVQTSLGKADSALQEHQDISTKADKASVYIKDDTAKLSTILSLSTLGAVGATTSTTNPEWKHVITDSEDKILLGIKQDGEWCVYTDFDNIFDCVVSSYAAA